MDGRAAISDNVEALKRILGGLFAMARLVSSPLAGEDGSARRGKAEPPAAPGEGSGRRFTLPRHLRLAILRILRPAEAAARRLVIAAARGLVVPLPPATKPKPKPFNPEPLLRRFGIAVVVSADDARAVSFGPAAVLPPAKPRALSLPLFDPPRLLSNQLLSNRRRYTAAHAAPRILLPGITQPYILPPPPSRDDPVDATRLDLRLASLAAALDDLPAQARRYARWKALNDRSRRAGIARRVSALRPGRPPGGRLSRFDPSALPRRNTRDIDEILAHAHALALYALQYPDTS